MKIKKILWGLFLVFVLLVIAGECAAKFWWQLGDPPLSVADRKIDYLFAPNQVCQRFGNRIVYNDASMRCDFNVLGDALKGIETDKRILVMGDSVINGGVLTDHEKLGTTLLQRKHPEYAILNISAGSWGPGNCLAYLNKFGTFEAQTLVLELNSHDVWEDDPIQIGGADVGKDISLPDRKPLCALSELINRYGLPWIKRKLHMATLTNKVDVPRWSENAHDAVEYNTLVLKKLFSMPWKKKVLLIHRTRAEAEVAEPSEGEQVLMKFARENNIPCVLFKTAAEDYRDSIHLSLLGHKHLADCLEKVLFSSGK